MELRLRQCALVLDWNALFIWEKNMRRQALNVFECNLLGASVRPVTSGTATQKMQQVKLFEIGLPSLNRPTIFSDRCWSTSISNASQRFSRSDWRRNKATM